MDTVAITAQQTQDKKGLEITSTKRRLKRHFLIEAKRMRKSRMEYYSESDLFDFAREDTELMKNFFNRLCFHQIPIDRIRKVCFDHLLNSNGDSNEKKLFKMEFENLIAFHDTMLYFQNLISEKAYYYENISEELAEVKKYRSGTAS